MPDLLLELRSEEIPARMQRKAAGDLKKLVTDALVEAGLTYEGAREYWTPRRLTLDIRGLNARSRRYPRGKEGAAHRRHEQAIDGFLRGAGLASIDEAHVQSDPKKGDFYVAHIVKPGRPADEIIAEVMPGIIRNFPWPKSMRSGAASAKPGALRWVRPLQSIVCMFGSETRGDAGHSRSRSTASSPPTSPTATASMRRKPSPSGASPTMSPASKRPRSCSMPSAASRSSRTDAANIAFANGLELVEDEGLLEEVSGLVEWPQVLMGTFEEDFLAIPAEIIRLTIKTNQKCFVTRPAGAEGLSNHFILVANIEAKDGGKEIVHGNGKVVRARLSDARHFWTRDQHDLPDLETLVASAEKFGLDLKKPLDQRMAKLDALNVTFHAKLGTQGERVQRIRALAAELAKVTGADPELVDRAVVLAKADLRTEAVGEFPELQGIMGRKYALLQGEAQAVADAIEDHYKPQGPSDRVPSDPVAITVALADKLDTLIGFWAIDEKPTGSKDPYALRRAALGVIRILLENEIRLPLLSRSSRMRDLLSFFHDRLKVYLRDLGARYDLIDAVLTPEADDLLMVARRVEALTAFITSEDGKNLLAGTKRATQLARRRGEEGHGGRRRHRLRPASRLPAEKDLHAAIVVATQRGGRRRRAGGLPVRHDGAVEAARAGRHVLRRRAGQRRGRGDPRQPPGAAGRDPRGHRHGCGLLEDHGIG